MCTDEVGASVWYHTIPSPNVVESTQICVASSYHTQPAKLGSSANADELELLLDVDELELLLDDELLELLDELLLLILELELLLELLLVELLELDVLELLVELLELDVLDELLLELESGVIHTVPMGMTELELLLELGSSMVFSPTR